MPIYEFYCDPCGQISSIYFRTSTDSPSLCCRHCSSDTVRRILSTFASPLSDADKMDRLDPKYDKQVDAALAKAPAASDPNHYLRKMASFSQAKE
ncbi:MAG: zinc ribbon domain-containing protein [bacterium]|nr:zinc ribbon domain-containing protein [bacterium]